MNLNELSKEIHKTAAEHGWWETTPSFPEVIALCHSELSEALEEYREAKPTIYFNCCEALEKPCLPKDESECLNYGKEATCGYRSKKPEGTAVELADCIIRILDYCGNEGIDIDDIVRAKMDYNKTRTYRHGGKRI